jgi:hypothetical protein
MLSAIIHEITLFDSQGQNRPLESLFQPNGMLGHGSSPKEYSSCCWNASASCSRGMGRLQAAHVDLAGDGGGDEGGAAFLQ